ncbi:Uncharacterised protein [Yersinia similis]|nr:Uncharacterised protein [Yersinia similis]
MVAINSSHQRHQWLPLVTDIKINCPINITVPHQPIATTYSSNLARRKQDIPATLMDESATTSAIFVMTIIFIIVCLCSLNTLVFMYSVGLS